MCWRSFCKLVSSANNQLAKSWMSYLKLWFSSECSPQLLFHLRRREFSSSQYIIFSIWGTWYPIRPVTLPWPDHHFLVTQLGCWLTEWQASTWWFLISWFYVKWPSPPWRWRESSWKKSYEQPSSLLKSRDITFPTKVHLVKAMVFPVWELNCKESWVPKNWCFWTVVLERLLRVPWTTKRSNQTILNEISLEYSLEYSCWSWNSNTLATWCEELTHLKKPWCWERLRAGGDGNNRGWDGWMESPNQWT